MQHDDVKTVGSEKLLLYNFFFNFKEMDMNCIFNLKIDSSILNQVKGAQNVNFREQKKNLEVYFIYIQIFP